MKFDQKSSCCTKFHQGVTWTRHPLRNSGDAQGVTWTRHPDELRGCSEGDPNTSPRWAQGVLRGWPEHVTAMSSGGAQGVTWALHPLRSSGGDLNTPPPEELRSCSGGDLNTPPPEELRGCSGVGVRVALWIPPRAGWQHCHNLNQIIVLSSNDVKGSFRKVLYFQKISKNEPGN